MLTLKVINLWAGPGTGKSTTAAGLFNIMKSRGASVELVTEFAKDLTWERNHGTLLNQLVVLAEQDRRLRRLEGHVEFAITDSPLPLGIAYMTEEYAEWCGEAATYAYQRYHNLDVFLRRDLKAHPYQTAGRNQSEAAALALDAEIRDIFVEHAEQPHYVTMGKEATFEVFQHVERARGTHFG